MLSQPFVISILLIFLGFDPYYVLLTATATHLFFMHYISSGASKYPEYPFAFFVVISSSRQIFDQFNNNVGMLVLLSFALIIILSRLTAVYVYYKRKFIEKITLKLIASPKEIKIKHHMLFSLIYSFISGTIFAYVLILLSAQVMKLCSEIIEYPVDMNNLLVAILVGIFTPYFISKKKLKASFVGIIIATIFFFIIK